MSNLTLFKSGGQLSTKFASVVANDLGEGIRGSYGIISIKAGRFRIKYKGQENVIQGAGPDGRPVPVATIDVVILKANPFLNKQYYEGKYAEGSNSPPDCYSLDGKVPSPNAKKPQCINCALCPKNQFGSLIGDNGVKQKACRDTKKLAIVPVSDIRNGALGGAMLFRVPPSSLKDLSTMADELKARGYPYNSVVVRIGFDMEVSHPKPTFDAVRMLSDDEADQVIEMLNSDSVERVLADNEPIPDAEDLGHPAHAPQPVVAMPPAQPAQPAPAPVQQPQPQPVYVAPAAPPVQQPQPAQPIHPGAFAVAPFSPTAPPPGPEVFRQPSAQPMAAPIASVFAATPIPPGAQETAEAAPEPAEKAKRTRRAPVEPIAGPVASPSVLPAGPADAAPGATQLDNDISAILGGLSAFGGGK